MPRPVSRRDFCTLSAAASIPPIFCPLSSLAQAAHSKPSTTLGLVIYCRRHLQSHLQKTTGQNLFQPLVFADECIRLRAGGMQVNLSNLQPAESRAIRARCDESGLFAEGIIQLPKTDTDLARFERDIQSAKACGAQLARTTIIPGRRYEQFRNYEDFKRAAANGETMLRRSMPLLEKHRFKIAIENHKDQRNAERLALFESLSSEYVGACLDTGNSMALLEDPIETAKVLAPWTMTVHLKDQALARYEDGFLLADIALGEGDLDLVQIVDLVRQVQPKVHFALELITRDPLKVPCLTDDYYRVFRTLPAKQLASMLQLSNARQPSSLTTLSDHSAQQRIAIEEANITTSLKYARDVLKLS